MTNDSIPILYVFFSVVSVPPLISPHFIELLFTGMCAHCVAIPLLHGFNQTFHVPKYALLFPYTHIAEGKGGPEAERHTSHSPPTCKRRRSRAGRIQAAHATSPSVCSPGPASSCHPESVEVNVLLSERGSCSCSDCSMDESWFVTPPPCFTAEGPMAEASPMEDLLIEHPSMSVYVSPGHLPAMEESAISLSGSVR